MMMKLHIPRLFLYVVASCLLLWGVCFVFIALFNPRFSHLMRHTRYTDPRASNQLPQDKIAKLSAPRVGSPERKLSSLTPPLNQPQPGSDSQTEDTQVGEKSAHYPKVSGTVHFFRSSRKNISHASYIEKEADVISPNDVSSQNYNNVLQNSSRNAVTRDHSEPEKDAQDQKVKSLTRTNQWYLIVKTTGRLGNFLFEFASAFCIAKLNNLKLLVEDGTHWQYLRHQDFRAPKQLWKQVLTLPYRGHYAGTCCGFNPKILTLKPINTNHALYGYDQSWKYFEPCKSELKQAILFKDSVIQKAVKTVSYLKKKLLQRTLVGVHVRMEDYLDKKVTQSGRYVAPPGYYHRAMTYFRSKFHDVTFVVITSQRNWFKHYVTNASDVTVLSRSASPAVDMEVLSRMDHVIISVGTFSWWIAYKNNGTVVCYKDFYEPDSEYGREMWNNATDFLYPGWVLL